MLQFGYHSYLSVGAVEIRTRAIERNRTFNSVGTRGKRRNRRKKFVLCFCRVFIEFGRARRGARRLLRTRRRSLGFLRKLRYGFRQRNVVGVQLVEFVLFVSQSVEFGFVLYVALRLCGVERCKFLGGFVERRFCIVATNHVIFERVRFFYVRQIPVARFGQLVDFLPRFIRRRFERRRGFFERCVFGNSRAQKFGRVLAYIAYARVERFYLYAVLLRLELCALVHLVIAQKRKNLAYRFGLLLRGLFQKLGILALLEQIHVFELVFIKPYHAGKHFRSVAALCDRLAVFIQHALCYRIAFGGKVVSRAARVFFRPAFNRALYGITIRTRDKLELHARTVERQIDHIGKRAAIARAVQREHDTVEYRCFARARFAANAKQIAPPDRVEIEFLSVGKRIYAFDDKLNGLHFSAPP